MRLFFAFYAIMFHMPIGEADGLRKQIQEIGRLAAGLEKKFHKRAGMFSQLGIWYGDDHLYVRRVFGIPFLSGFAKDRGGNQPINRKPTLQTAEEVLHDPDTKCIRRK